MPPSQASRGTEDSSQNQLFDLLSAQAQAINALAESVGLLAQATAALLAEVRYEEMPEDGGGLAATVRTLDG